MAYKKKHVNIPVFIPHLGCPNMCVFCNQRSISGVNEFDAQSVRSDIEAVLKTVDRDNTELELAFFGGSFTGIDRALMTELLGIGKSYLDSGKIDSMRCSTRPDYINDEILSVLREYGMKTVELGIQSMDNKVLSECKRGHCADVTKEACKAVVQAGFELVGQMMIGLPGADSASEVACARFISECGASSARVYPTVVFCDTELCAMAKSGTYMPLSLDEAIERTKRVLCVFDENGIKVIRVGLCSSENLTDPSHVYAGANDVSIGEMAMSALYLEKMCDVLDRMDTEGKRYCTVFCAEGAVSKVSGHRRKNKEMICQKYGFRSVKILEKSDLIGYNIRIEIN